MASTLKAYKGFSMEGGMARWYDKTTRKAMPEIKQLAARICRIAPASGEVLEIAPGPGFLSIELARRGLAVRAVDISKTFVEIARRNAAADGVRVRFEQGNAAALPLEDECVDFVVCRAAFKNFTEPVKALVEMKRVLRPGGTALLIDMRKDVPVEETRQYVKTLGVGLFDRWFMQFVFRAILLKRAYRLEDIQRMTEEAGWPEPLIETEKLGFEAWMTK